MSLGILRCLNLTLVAPLLQASSGPTSPSLSGLLWCLSMLISSVAASQCRWPGAYGGHVTLQHRGHVTLQHEGHMTFQHEGVYDAVLMLLMLLQGASGCLSWL